jgi:hypothetical protein
MNITNGLFVPGQDNLLGLPILMEFLVPVSAAKVRPQLWSTEGSARLGGCLEQQHSHEKPIPSFNESIVCHVRSKDNEDSW